jgi:hypothetical protein
VLEVKQMSTNDRLGREKFLGWLKMTSRFSNIGTKNMKENTPKRIKCII